MSIRQRMECLSNNTFLTDADDIAIGARQHLPGGNNRA